MNRNNLRFTPAAFAIALIFLGIQHIWHGEFIAGRAPVWPESFPGQTTFAYLTGMLFIVTGIAVVFGKKAKLFLLISGFTILLWAGLRNIVDILINPEYGGLLTNTMKAFALGSGAFIVANNLRDNDTPVFASLILPKLALLGQTLLGLFLLVGGIQHFIFADFVKFLVPAWIPSPLFWTYFAGVALVLAGISLITRIQTQLASLLAGIMVAMWLLVLHIPRAVELRNANERIAVCEALAFSCFLLTIYFAEKEKHEVAAIKPVTQ